MREKDIDGTINAKFQKAIKSIRIINWMFHWFGWVLNPLLDRYGKPIACVVYDYCANCMYRHSCGASCLFAGGVTPKNILQMMHDNNVDGLHVNWSGVFKELEKIYEGCRLMKLGNTSWSDKVYKL